MNNSLRMLILDAPDNTSELFIALLNKNGMAVNAERLMDRKLLIDSLQSEDWDLLLLNEDVEDCEAADFVSMIKKSSRHTAVFVLSRALGISELARAQQDGVAGLVSLEHPDYSVISIRRECDALRLRQQQRRILQENAELQQRSRLLLDSSREAIAYIHEGMHVYANASYLALFGHESIDDVLCMPFIDMVDAKDRGQLKDCLKALPHTSDAHGASRVDARQLSLLALDAEGAAFDAIVVLTPTLYEGEHCLQVFISREQKAQMPAKLSSPAPAATPDPLPELEVAAEEFEDEVIEFDNVEELTPEPPVQMTHAAPVVLHPRSAQRISPASPKSTSNSTSKVSPTVATKVTPVAGTVAAGAVSTAGGLNEATIAAAMSNGQMSLVYYPVIAMSDMEPELYDIELSLLDSRASRYPPEALNAAVGHMSLGCTLDKWMVDKAVRVIAELHRQGQSLMFTLPVSSQSIRQAVSPQQATGEPGFAEWLAKLIGNLTLDPASLTIDLQQDDVLEDTDAAGALVSKLREHGFRVCISHFNPSPAIDAFVASHAVDYLRLAVELTRRAGRDKTVIGSINEICAHLHAGSARVIASRIEDFEALGALWEADVDLVQGEYFQKFAKDLRVDSFAEQSGLLRHAG